MKKIVFSLILLMSFGMMAQAQISKVKPSGKVMKQYQKAEWTVALKGKFTNPYDQKQITLDMEFTAPSGKTDLLPCYFVAGKSGATSTWNARFTPVEKGLYKVAFVLKQEGKEVSRTKPQAMASEPTSGKGFLRPYSSWAFRYDNGEIFRGLGENIGWESRDEDDSKYFKGLHEDKRFNYQYMLTKLAQNGGNFFRTWMIYWNLPVDWKQVQNNSRYTNTTSAYNESAMKRMDQLVNLCDSLGIHMMLALESHVGLMGSGWETSSYNVKNGGFAATPREFFESPKAREQYKNKLRLMVARYGYSPSIGAWEFFNEVDNAMYQGAESQHIPHEVVASWHQEMASYLKSIDPYKHLVTTSVSHRQVKGMNTIASIDFNQHHIYCNTLGIPEAISKNGKEFGKPYVIGEFGYHWDWSVNFNDSAAEFDRDFKEGLWLGLFTSTPILPMSWWWEFFENRGLMSYFKVVSAVMSDMIAAGKGSFKPLEVATYGSSFVGYSVDCGGKVYVYLLNKGKEAAKASALVRVDGSAAYSSKIINTVDGTQQIGGDYVANGEIIIKDLLLPGNGGAVLTLTKK